MKLSQWLLDLIFPPLCPFCHDVLDKNLLFCANCQNELPWNEEENHYCWENHGILCIAPLWYRDHVLDGVHRFKFNGVRQYAHNFGTLMAQTIPKDHTYDYITWAPIAPKRLKKRGYNQAELLAKVISDELNLPSLDLLEKYKETLPQSSLHDDTKRFENVKDSYRLRQNQDLLRGKSILFVDDVLTTGNTMSACAQTLLAGGARSVSCVVLARSRK
ncbi:MAG: ComF family protein [Eubacteriales bacterium]